MLISFYQNKILLLTRSNPSSSYCFLETHNCWKVAQLAAMEQPSHEELIRSLLTDDAVILTFCSGRIFSTGAKFRRLLWSLSGSPGIREPPPVRIRSLPTCFRISISQFEIVSRIDFVKFEFTPNRILSGIPRNFDTSTSTEA